MTQSKLNKNHLILIFLTIINLLNYFDRYILVAVLPVIQKEMVLSDSQLGFIGTAFMVVYFLVSPLFGWLGDRIHRFRLMGTGIVLWSLATAISGYARSYAALLFSRSLVGVGEASYVAVSPALMGDLFPKEKRGRIFAVFFMAIPVGSALGFLLGGLLEAHFGWRTALLIAGGPGLVLGTVLFFLKDVPREYSETAQEDKNQSFIGVTKVLRKNTVYVGTVMGSVAYTFVVGGMSFWMPSYLLRTYHVELSQANMYFGALTVVGGLAGTFIGGYWADYKLKTDKTANLRVSAITTFVAAILFFLVLHMQNFYSALAVILLLEVFLFMSTSPINAEIVNCVPVYYRSMANAVSVFMIHFFGDAISPSLIGQASDRWGLAAALQFLPVGIFACGLFWLLAARSMKVSRS